MTLTIILGNHVVYKINYWSFCSAPWTDPTQTALLHIHAWTANTWLFICDPDLTVTSMTHMSCLHGCPSRFTPKSPGHRHRNVKGNIQMHFNFSFEQLCSYRTCQTWNSSKLGPNCSTRRNVLLLKRHLGLRGREGNVSPHWRHRDERARAGCLIATQRILTRVDKWSYTAISLSD